MASFLADFNARLATYVHELEQMQTRNKEEHTFSPSFWLEHADFTLARDVFVAVRAPTLVCLFCLVSVGTHLLCVFQQAGGSIGHEVTKFSLVYSSTKAPGAKEAASICQALDKPCEQLIAAAKVALFSGTGPSLANEIITDSLYVIPVIVTLELCCRF